ncbi:hypothetical protein CIP107559_00815 [Corynebacterium diphtheriae]|nr:hypothetical protein CIP107533_00722 [Corynebacterium diphtheriae]CAB0588011.1 hypothetical protein CIP107555_00578 [Corynebacterium diphtheriae]CAB0591881.1 hypothetical protein CIP107552_00833 [Corynebacterium diphtheriae]CAB0591919.1 hypothetical protein CIP107559_00815 [Corynebacterium diphtheriae]CAB0595326.1 hypothetical protein CIP107557_00820 [Corynebacterium diphtheriae]
MNYVTIENLQTQKTSSLGNSNFTGNLVVEGAFCNILPYLMSAI